MAPDPKFLGDRIRRLREAHGLSQMALRRVTGLSQSTLYRAEVGGVVTPSTAARLAEVLRCRPEELLEHPDMDMPFPRPGVPGTDPKR